MSRAILALCLTLILGGASALGATSARACGCEARATVERKLRARVVRLDAPSWSLDVEWLDSADGLPTHLALAPALHAPRRRLVAGAAVLLSLRVQDGQTTVYAAE